MVYIVCLLVVIVFLIVTIAIFGREVKSLKRIIFGKDCQIRKFEQFYWILENWLEIKQDGYNLAEWFCKRGYKTIAIYGAKELGARLCDELKNTEIEVAYFIDRDACICQDFADIRVFRPYDNLDDVDLIVVTAIFYYIDIADEMTKHVKCPVVSLETIINEL